MFEKILALAIYVVIVVVLWVIVKKRKKDTNFDEMQEKVRAEGYKIAFFSVLAMLTGIIIYDVIAGEALPQYVLSGLLIVVVMLSFTIWGIYCIRHDSFFGIGQDWKTYLCICIVVGAIHCSSFVSEFVRIISTEHDEAFMHLFFAKAASSAAMTVTFLSMAVAIAIKMIASKKESED
ncbi:MULTISPECIES: DUF6442 family protein [unclassified Butyrivibrio]|uniref:DUF6442 family protein n=1 Tax=unclassified Butyrivibrio TaxID=2639466 RepID=UPI00040BDB62|nr:MULTISPECIES: DUF6442 family protein [unclassified Butyrivibrio]